MENKYIDDLKEIKEIMNRSSRFISLSGLSGMAVGIIALVAAYIAHRIIFSANTFQGYDRIVLDGNTVTQLLLIASGTVVLAIAVGIFFTTRETKKRNLKIWDPQTKRLLINLFIPLIAGGVLCLMLLFKGYMYLLAPLTLIFHGLALVNASKYTLPEIRSLGILDIILGLIAIQFPGFGLIFWAIGFGILHILYGLFIQRKYTS